MKALTVEWVSRFAIHDSKDEENRLSMDIPVVRLPEVDAVIAEAVWAMEIIKAIFVVDGDECQLRAKAFLASPDVKAWRERQKKKEDVS